MNQQTILSQKELKSQLEQELQESVNKFLLKDLHAYEVIFSLIEQVKFVGCAYEENFARLLGNIQVVLIKNLEQMFEAAQDHKKNIEKEKS